MTSPAQQLMRYLAAELGKDVVHNSLSVTEVEHGMIHLGIHFIIDDYDADVDTGAPKYYLLRTPDTTMRMHFLYVGSASAAGLFEFFEEPTITDDGTELDAVNNERNSDNTADFDVFVGPTVTDDGARLAVGLVGGGRGIGATGGVSVRHNELVLRQNTDYLVKFTTIADNNRVTVNLEWYEHEAAETT